MSEPEERVLQLTLDAAETVVPLGDSLIFQLDAEGPPLMEWRLSTGDGQSLVDDALGANVIGRRIAHLYDEEGTFVARAEVETFEGDIVTDELTVEILPPSDP